MAPFSKVATQVSFLYVCVLLCPDWITRSHDPDRGGSAPAGSVGTGNTLPQRRLHGSDKVGHERDSFES